MQYLYRSLASNPAGFCLAALEKNLEWKEAIIEACVARDCKFNSYCGHHVVAFFRGKCRH